MDGGGGSFKGAFYRILFGFPSVLRNFGEGEGEK